MFRVGEILYTSVRTNGGICQDRFVRNKHASTLRVKRLLLWEQTWILASLMTAKTSAMTSDERETLAIRLMMDLFGV